MSFFDIELLAVILVALLICSAFFSGSEIGMMAINRYRLRHFVRKKHRSAQLVQNLLKTPERLLGVILIGNTLTNNMATAITTLLALKLIGEHAVAWATLLLTLVILVFAEVTPKTLAASNPQRFAFIVAWPLRVLLTIFYPVVWLVNLLAGGTLRLFGIRLEATKSDQLSAEELRTVVHEAGGAVGKEHRDMLLGIFELEHVTINDIMVPRNEIIGIDLADEWDDILEQLQTSQHTRLPVYEDEINHVKGFLHTRNAVGLVADPDATKDDLSALIQPAYFVPENTSLGTQLINFRRGKNRFGLVVDEYGDVQGLVTLEDILEEIVGEFTTDIAALSRDITRVADGSYMIDGSILIRDLNRELNWKLPMDGPKTLSGLLIEYLEFIPPQGTCIRIANHVLEVIRLQDTMVKTVRAWKMKA